MAKFSKTSKKGEIVKVKICRICDKSDLLTFLQLGPTPIPNGFLKKSQLNSPEKFYPLDVCFCPNCGLTQLAHVVTAEIMFHNYLYIPSTSKTMVNHFRMLTYEALERINLNTTDLILDIGSNDGTLLKSFKSQGLITLGIDPAKNLAQKANLQGIKTINDFFKKSSAITIKSEYKQAKLITATNVVAHIHDLHNFFEGIKLLLAPNGLFIAEFPYMIDLIKKTEFDTIYQEHLSYFSLTPLNRLLAAHGLNLIDAKRIPVHGGSLRIFVTKDKTKVAKRVQNLLQQEENHGILDPKTYLKFRKKVDKIRHNLVQLLWQIRLKNKNIVGYGASAKGNVFLNYCRIGTETLDYIVDSIPYKQGKYTPGMHIPIYPESKLSYDKPDYALILAWNFKEEIIEKQWDYRQTGGKFIVTIPKLEIL